MSKFTPGPWWIAPPLFDGDVIFARPQTKGRLNEVVATSITNKADALLIASAPIMYELLKEFALLRPDVVGDIVHHTRELLARIDGEEAGHA